MSGILYIVATPIGNLGDITRRAAQTLDAVDFIAAEDTRVTMKLLNHLGISKPIVSYYEHNKIKSGHSIISRIEGGETCALVCDAGTPCISDPGEPLCAAARDAGIKIVPIPGACAAITALSASGFASGRFCFEGFLSINKKSRREHLESLKRETRTMIFYEAPHKLCSTLADLCRAFSPERELCIARELTKIHEEIRKTTLGEAAEHYAQNPPKGEFVLIISGNPDVSADDDQMYEHAELPADKYVMLLMSTGVSHADAVKLVAKQRHISRSELYRKTLPENIEVE